MLAIQLCQYSFSRFSWPICRIIVCVEGYKSASVTQAKSSATSRRFLCSHQIFKMRSQSARGFLVLVVFGCVLPSILAAPSSAAAGNEENELNLDKAYGSDIVKVAAGVCDKLANGGTIDQVMLEIAKEEGMEKIDMNKVREMIEKYGCSATKWLQNSCFLWGIGCWGR
ncbi:uncharacterized protein LOC116930053 isoform X2 [Daphnia magna]|uniref:uncharacterized protein LOC116930053 isoform X2 n=1 Tax=Daphnia magna TaxID=35525 RepID=UPI001E1BB657|nr:uncharacterized protein LOC116930053 isoform X2 [Daphnia magna]XP_045024430.1 uncharacterized protein LOC116930053 isoform X2 [Daphnia magna]